MNVPTLESFASIITELERRPLEQNNYRKRTGSGRSQAFGVVNRRCLPPDYSRNNWRRPYLYKLLLDYGNQYVDISFNAITVNQNYRAGKHYDRHNGGESYLVAFGSYTGGDLLIHEGDLSGTHNIWCNPIKADFSKICHSVEHFTGDRYSLVYYNFTSPRMPPLPPPSVKEEEGKWYFYRGEEKITKGLPHPLLDRDRAEILATAKKKKLHTEAKYSVSFK
jgi:hypothetical protein